MIKFVLNGQTRSFGGDPTMPLLWFLREEAGLKGTKFGCGIGLCGACTVHIDGVATRTCTLPMSRIQDRHITTIEGLANGNQLHPVQVAWLEENVPQCGYCQAGVIMSVASLLNRVASPTDDEIDQNITNICRCGTYQRIRRAVHRAADSGSRRSRAQQRIAQPPTSDASGHKPAKQ